MVFSKGIHSKRKALAVAVSCVLAASLAQAQEIEEFEDYELEEDSGALIEEVVVWGVRASQAKAIDLKRNSSNVVDSIVAEDIGRMPDTTITDSLQRVPGVQINREANQGTSLNVRGMPQVLTTLNGEQFLSPWTITGVGANYSDIPAGMIGGVDVFKSTSAEQLAGGISGLIDLKTIDPADLEEGWTGKLKLEASKGSMTSDELSSDSPDHDVSFHVGHNNDLFSFIAGGFHSSTNAANYQMYEDQRLGFLDVKGGTPGDPLDLDGDGDLVNDWYLVPGEYGARANFMERERTGGSLGLNADIGDNFVVRADVFYTAMEQYDRGVKAAFVGQSSINSYDANGILATDETDLYNVLQPGTRVGAGADISYVDVNGETQTRSLHTLQVAELLSPEFKTISTNNINRTAALNTNLQLDYTNHDNFTAGVRVVHSVASKETRSAQLDQGTPAWLWVDADGIPGKDPLNVYDVTVDYRSSIPSFSFDADLSDAELLQKYQGYANGEDTEASLNVIRADASYAFADDSFIQSVDVGLRYGVRDAEQSLFYYVAPTARYSTWDDPRVPADKRYLLREGNDVWEKYPEWRDFDFSKEDSNVVDIGGMTDNGFSLADTVAFSDFGPISGFEGGVSALDPSDWDNPLTFMNRLYPGTKTVQDPGESYTVEEASTSAYTQLNFETELGFPISGNFGLRVINTKRTVDKTIVPDVLDRFNSVGYEDWNKIAFVSGTETLEHSYTDVLPSFNVNLYPHDDVVVRVAAAKTTARNDLENVGSGLVLWYQQCAKTDEDGNRVMVLDTNGNPVGANVSCVGGGSDQGNPEIKPWRATVYNTTAEWYFGENAILGGGLFLIDVSNSVEGYQDQRNYLDGDGINRGNLANVWTTANAGASDLYGLEMGYRQPFSFLPGEFFSSTGLEFNYTYSNSESADVDVDGKAFPLPSNSKHQTNFILWYEKDALSFRVAYNWRSEEYIGRVGLNTNEAPLSLGNWQEPTGYLDLSVGYWLNDTVSFYLNGTNVTEQDKVTYSQYSDQFHSLWVQDRRIAMGVTISL